MKTVKTLFSALFGVLAACLLLGCLNPVSFNTSAPETESASKPDLSDWEPFDVTLTINGDGSVSMGGDRSARAVAGFGSDNIKASGTGARNYMQLIVAQEGAVTSFSEARQELGSSGAAFQVDVTSGKTYDFLLLMGHWEKAADEYKAEVPPTLLAAGLHTQEIQSGSNTVTISMYPIVVETEFTAGSVKVKDPGVDRVFPLIPGNWNAVWKVTRGASGTNPFDILVNAQKKITGQSGVTDLKLKSDSAVGTPAPGAGSLSGNVYTFGIGTYTLPQIGAEGSANFKLEYVPFGVHDTAVWADFSSVSEAGGLPTWIIRNGINDLVQNAQTDFSIPDNWPGSTNGNGAVPWKITVKTPSDGGSALEVKDGSFEGPAASQTPTIGFTTDGYIDTAEGYYAVVPQGTIPSGYSDYTKFPDSYGPGTYTGQEVTLPAAGGDYDVYVIIYKDGAVSDPLVINTKEASGKVDWIWGDALYLGLYVKSDGDDGNTGVKADPLKTVQKALEKLAAAYTPAWPGYGAPDESPGGIIILDAVPVAAQIVIDNTGSKYPPIVFCDDSESAGGKLQAQSGIGTNKSLLNLTNGAKVTLAGDLILAGTGQAADKIRGVGGTGSTFTMNGGEIIDFFDNTVGGYAGGVNLAVNSTFTMNSGKISGNAATSGGGVYVSGKFTMNNGEISDNSASFGGGVNVNGTFIMKGGKISDNSAPTGAGVYVSGSTFTMDGGEISDNSGNGGGVYMTNNTTFTMHNGKISGNSASYGGGVHINSATFIMDGGEIFGNTAFPSSAASYGGGGVYINNGKFKKTGGTIYGYIEGDAKSNAVRNLQDNKSILLDKGHAIALRDTSSGETIYLKEAAVGPGANLAYKYPNGGDISGWD